HAWRRGRGLHVLDKLAGVPLKLDQGSEGFDLDGNEKNSVGLSLHGGAAIGAAAGAGKATGERVDQHGQPETLVPADGQNRAARWAIECRGVRSRLALMIDDPAFGNRLARGCSGADLAFRDDAGGDIEHERMIALGRYSNTDRVGREPACGPS